MGKGRGREQVNWWWRGGRRNLENNNKQEEKEQTGREKRWGDRVKQDKGGGMKLKEKEYEGKRTTIYRKLSVIP